MSIPAVSVMTLYLLAASVKDIINKKISFFLLSAGIIPVITCITVRLYAAGNENGFSQIIFSHALGLVIGVVFIFISRLTDGKLGSGDAAIFCICGAALGYEKLLIVIMSAFLLAALYAAAMLAMGRLNKKSSFAFIPFIMLGYVMAEVLSGKV